MMRYLELKKFKQQHGHCNPPASKKQYTSLLHWCIRQKELKKKQPKKFNPNREQRLTELGFDWRLKDRCIPDEALLDDIKRLHRKLNRTPSKVDIEKHGKYYLETYESHFGNISSAQKKAGLTTNFTPKLKDNVLLADLLRLHNKLKRAPSANDINKYGKYSISTYITHFGSILTARQKAGLPINNLHYIPNQQLLDDLIRLHAELQRTPSIQDINQYGKYGKYSPVTHIRRFGSIGNARKKAGLGKLIRRKRTRK